MTTKARAKREAADHDVVSFRELLKVFGAQFASFWASGGKVHSPSGHMLHELQAPADEKRHLTNAYSMGTILVEHAMYHLEGFARLIEEGALPLPAYSCLRSSLEAAAVAAWLLDPAIAPKKRIWRGLTRLKDGFTAGSKIQGIRINPAFPPDMEARCQQLDKVASDLGLPKLGKINFTELAGDELQVEHSYRILSCLVHAHPWATLDMAYKVTPTDDPFEFHAEISVRPDALIEHGYHTFYAVVVPTWHWCRLAGKNHPQLNRLISEVGIGMNWDIPAAFWTHTDPKYSRPRPPR